jgi:hypothetical protein
MIRWSGDIENYCNILPIFSIFLLAIFYCPFGPQARVWFLNFTIVKISHMVIHSPHTTKLLYLIDTFFNLGTSLLTPKVDIFLEKHCPK